MEKALECFIHSYDAIALQLQQLQNPDVAVSRTVKGCKAKAFFKAMTSKDMWLMFHFLLDALTIITEVSLKFV